MTEATFQYFAIFNLLNVGIAVVFIGLFLQRDRSIYSPGVAMSLILFYLYTSHFLIEGYDHEIYRRVPMAQVLDMQLWVTSTIAAALFACYVGTRRPPEVRRTFDSDQVFRVLLLLGLAIFVANMVWRLNRVDWSAERFVTALLLSRASEDWAQQGAVNTGSPVDSLIRITFLFCGYAFAVAAQSRRLVLSVVAHVLLAASLVFFFFGGSRTAFIAPIFAYLLLRFMRSRNKAITAALMLPVVLGVLYASSFVLGFRTVGFERMDEFGGGELRWHTDDNYPRLIYASWEAWRGTDPIDGLSFILASLFNFVPRVLWPGKPQLSAEFFEPYKDFHYVTISAFGELQAMMHPLLAATAFVLLVWAATRLAYRLFRSPDLSSFALYITYLLYIYSVMRSLANISAAIYIPALMLLVHRFTRDRPERAEAPEGEAPGPEKADAFRPT